MSFRYLNLLKVQNSLRCRYTTVEAHKFGTSVAVGYHQDEKAAKAWQEKLKREAAPDGPSSEEVYYGAYQSKRKPLSADVLNILSQVPRDFTFGLPLFKQIYNVIKKHLLYHDQRYIDLRVDILGYDLAASHFVVHRGGRVKFKGSDKWIQKDDDDEYHLPRHHSSHYLVESLDLTGLAIIYDGLQNIENLYHMKWISFAKCPHFNDWCLDRLSDQNYRKLTHLDISYCPSITEAGLASVAKLRTLESINVAGLDHLRNLKLICLLLEEAISGLKVEGISYEEEKPFSNSTSTGC